MSLAFAAPLAVLVLVGVVTLVGEPVKNQSKVQVSAGKFIEGEREAPKSTTTTVSPAEWIDYSPNGANFYLKLPTQPKVSQSNTPAGTMTTYTSVTRDNHSAVIVGTVPLGGGVSGSNNKTVLKEVLNGSNHATGMEIKGQVFTTEGGTLYLDAVLSNNSVTTNVRYFIIGDKLYMLTVTSEDAIGDAASFNKLIKSFSYGTPPPTTTTTQAGTSA